MSIVEEDRAFVRTWDTAWNLKRVRNNREVEVASFTAGGKPTGPAIRARARILYSEESAYAGRLLAHKYPILHGLLVPLVHRLRGNGTMHIELTPVLGRKFGAAGGAILPGSANAPPSGSPRRGG